MEASRQVAARGTPLTSWLALSGATSSREAAALVFTDRDLDADPTLRQAALSGQIHVKQARQITKGLNALPDRLSAPQKAQAVDVFIDHAARTPADRIAALAPQVLAAVAPELVPDPDDAFARLEAQTRQAHARRHLTFTNDGDGSLLIRGSLPLLAATPFVKLINAYTEGARRAGHDHAVDRRDHTPVGPRCGIGGPSARNGGPSA